MSDCYEFPRMESSRKISFWALHGSFIFIILFLVNVQYSREMSSSVDIELMTINVWATTS